MKIDPTLIRRVWQALKQIEPDRLLSEGRVYGGGLHKLEPNELANVDASSLVELIPESTFDATAKQLSLF